MLSFRAVYVNRITIMLLQAVLQFAGFKWHCSTVVFQIVLTLDMCGDVLNIFYIGLKQFPPLDTWFCGKFDLQIPTS